MEWVLDGLMLFTIGYFALEAHKKGAVKSILSLASLVVSYMAAHAFTPKVAGIIGQFHVVNIFTAGINRALAEGDKTMSGMAGAGEQFVNQFTEMTGTGKLLDISLKVADFLFSRQVTTVVAFVAIFFFTATVMRIAVNVLNVAAMLPLIGSVNRFFGLIFGLLAGAVMCYVVCLVIGLLGTYFGDPFGVLDAAPDTFLFKFFYQSNLFTELID